MRKFLIPLLMAGAMIPAAAVAQDRDRDGNRDERRSERSERRIERHESNGAASTQDSRPERAERAPRIERVADQPRVDRRERRVEVAGQGGQTEVVQPTQVQSVRVRRDGGFLNGIREAGQAGTLEARPAPRDGNRDGRWTGSRDGNRDGRWTGSRDGVRDGNRDAHYDRNRIWSNQWRGDSRYNWRNYRDRNRSLFRLGSYRDPYGWGYRRFSIGFNIGSSYYGSNYWLDDPWAYRLPPAYGPYRWIRYYDDALLVNIYSGQVVDVINNFFW